MNALRTLWSELKDSFLMAMGAVAAHKLRSALTLLGVLVGVFSIILVMTIMRATQKNIEEDLNQLGGHTFFVQTWPALYFERAGNIEKYRRRKRINFNQGLEVEKRATLALNIGLEDGNLDPGTMVSQYNKTPPNINMLGDSPGSFATQNWVVHEGRALLESDLDSLRDVCVLGSDVAKTLFPFGSALGQRVSFNSVNYDVVGVLEPKGGMQGGQQDDFMVIPITTAINRYESPRWLNLTILVQARSDAEYDATVDQVRGIMRLIRKVPPGDEDGFEIISADSLMAQLEQFTRTLRLGITLVSSIALLAAGVGIMNIMLVSVTERTREIGVRRAIGAKKRNIMTQFIMEAIVLCELGGAFGVALGVTVGDIAAFYMKLPYVLPVDWVIIGLAICSVVGVVFGTYPAWKAANLDPIESLRYE
jgi:putative ABC transport system permease protein